MTLRMKLGRTKTLNVYTPRVKSNVASLKHVAQLEWTTVKVTLL